MVEEKRSKGQRMAGYFEAKMAEKGWDIVPGSIGKPEKSSPFVLPMPEGGRRLRETYQISNGSVIIARTDVKGHVFYAVDNTCIIFTENGILDSVRYPGTAAPTSHESEALQCAGLAMHGVLAHG